MVDRSKWKHKEHTNVLEERALCYGINRLARRAGNIGTRALILCDSMVVVLATSKGRSSAAALIQTMRRIAALLLGTGICLRVRCLRSERNPSDAASRGDDVVGYKSTEGVVDVASGARVPGYRPAWSCPAAARLGLDIEPVGGFATAPPGLTRGDNSFLVALGDESDVCVGLRSRPPGLQRISAEAAPCDIGTEDRSEACFGEASSRRDLAEKDQLPSSGSWAQFVPGAQSHVGYGE